MELSLTPATTSPRGVDLDMLMETGSRRRALIVDDEIESTTLLKMVLMKAGLDVVGALSGKESLQKCTRAKPDVILLDIMMPEMDGWETFTELRKLTSAPVIFVSARTEMESIVRGLQAGADDYLTKPYHPAELVARIQRVLERNNPVQHYATYHFPEISMSVNADNREVTYRSMPFYLPAKAFDVFRVLARFAPRMVNNDILANEVWGENSPKVQNRIKHLIFVLRKELEANPASPVLIVNREGIGYRLATERDIKR
jgi:DNA-binding response OmpR family regulator